MITQKKQLTFFKCIWKRITVKAFLKFLRTTSAGSCLKTKFDVSYNTKQFITIKKNVCLFSYSRFSIPLYVAFPLTFSLRVKSIAASFSLIKYYQHKFCGWNHLNIKVLFIKYSGQHKLSTKTFLNTNFCAIKRSPVLQTLSSYWNERNFMQKVNAFVLW